MDNTSEAIREREDAVRNYTLEGVSARLIAERLRMTSRGVARIRQRLRTAGRLAEAPTRKQFTVLTALFARPGFRCCTHCIAEKPDTDDFFAPEYAGQCRVCVFLKAEPSTVGAEMNANPRGNSTYFSEAKRGFKRAL